ncbi:MAG: hypothetical protein RL095_2125 [Verrucomicrobiota bacterium]|jgi:hypothetical protein
MSDEISPERKLAYYAGSGLQGLGLLLFLSVFVSFFSALSDFGPSSHPVISSSYPGAIQQTEHFPSGMTSSFIRAPIGIVLMIFGGFIKNIGARGLAGSGIVLNPKQAREDLEPYSRQAGGMVKDALDEADIKLGTQTQQVVLIRCRKCSTLNPEDAKFCKECGGQV